MNTIIVLPPSEARRIAAGEVIERPASALRELLDNAIDAQAKHIVIKLLAGGIEAITITDDGLGISPQDLPLTIISHATSKIRKAEDLDQLTTLGFRGEALASLAACAKVIITSKVQGQDAHQLLAEEGEVRSIKPTSHPVGTTIHISELFYNIPVRKRFLKSIASESRESLQVFYEKALAHPHIAFTLSLDGKPKLHLPVSSLADRAAALYPNQLSHQPLSLIGPQQLAKDGFSLQVISSPVHLFRSDKRHIHFYVNGRRILEYAPIQALMHAYSNVLPAGQFPSGFIFCTVRPDLVDFNIHPAKREAKFKNLPLIHRAINQLLSAKLHNTSHIQPIQAPITHPPIATRSYQPTGAPSPSNSSTPSTQSNKARGSMISDFLNLPRTSNTSLQPIQSPQARRSEVNGHVEQSWYYLGQVFGVFLVVERGDQLYLIDQHAAHERLRFEEILAKPPIIEALLAPIEMELTADQLMLIQLAQEELNALGVRFSIIDDHRIALSHVPSVGKSVAFWQEYLLNLSTGLKKTLYATMACHGSIKEGEYLDDHAAHQLIDQTFKLSEPYCPHGRPLWIQLSQDQLYRWIKRII